MHKKYVRWAIDSGADVVYNMFIFLRILILRFSEGIGGLVYEQVPETVFWIIVICVLLLGTIIATMMLFQYLIERNEDSRKQAILENQVEQLHREIEDIEEITVMDIIKKLNVLIVVNMGIKVLIVTNLQEKIATFVENLGILVMIVQKKRNK